MPATRCGAALLGLFVLSALVAACDEAAAQTTGILAPGNAIVTGFSGAPQPAQIPPGVDPGDQTFIDPGGPSAQVFNLQSPGAPPQAQVLATPPTFTVTAAQVGQVFGVALDNAAAPNMYLAASSAYGLPIVAPGQGGAPTRLRQGAAGATFMAGLFGPAAQGGGPGSIWRIDGVSGAVTLFANVGDNGAPNSGPALGGLAFDAASNSLFVADRQTGLIQRFNLSGALIGQYDHGVTGLTAAGATPLPYTPTQLDITGPQFSTTDPGTWDYAAPPRLIFGLGVHAGRLYYAVAAGLQVWSVSFNADGSFGSDARVEVQVPPANGPTEIAKITFDDSGIMILAERAAPTGDYEQQALAQPGIGRVLRYAPAPVMIAAGAPVPPGGAWQPIPDQYAIGFQGPMTNADGGAAVGYSYDATGHIDTATCSGFLWSTGEQLRNASDPTLAAMLSANGTLNLNGLQGNSEQLVEPDNVPPLLSYFVDYNPQYDDPGISGYLGDIAIPRTCGQGLPFAAPPWLPAGWFAPQPPPVLSCPSWMHADSGRCTCPNGALPAANGMCACPAGTTSEPGFQCCGFGTVLSGGQCVPVCPDGATDPASATLCLFGFNNVQSGGKYVCLNGATPSQQNWFGCITQSTFVTAPSCWDGWTKVNDPSLGVSLCEPTPAEAACEAQGENLGLNNTCQKICAPGSTPFPITQCCTAGEQPLPNGQCCPANAVPNPYTQSCCPAGSVIDAQTHACGPPPQCPPWQRDKTGACCKDGEFVAANGLCGPPPPPPRNSCQQSGNVVYCEPLHNVLCLIQQSVAGGCCPGGSTPTPNGTCIAKGPSCGTDVSVCCPDGQVPNFATGQCCPAGVTPLTGNGPGCGPPPPPPPPPPKTGCSGDYVQVGNECCLPSQVRNGTCGVVVLKGCPRGEFMDPKTFACGRPECQGGMTRGANGMCGCAGGDKYDLDTHKCITACTGDQVRDAFTGRCTTKITLPVPSPPPLTPAPTPGCAPGYTLGANGMCQRNPGTLVPTPSPTTNVPPPGILVPITPPPGGTLVPSPPIVPIVPPPGGPTTTNQPCPAGETRTDRGCVKETPPPPAGTTTTNPSCPSGETRTDRGCVKETTPPPAGTTTTNPSCPSGETRTDRGCVKATTPPAAGTTTAPKGTTTTTTTGKGTTTTTNRGTTKGTTTTTTRARTTTRGTTPKITAPVRSTGKGKR